MISHHVKKKTTKTKKNKLNLMIRSIIGILLLLFFLIYLDSSNNTTSLSNLKATAAAAAASRKKVVVQQQQQQQQQQQEDELQFILKNNNTPNNNKNENNPFTLVVTLQFISIQYKEEFIKEFTIISNYVHMYEKDTTLSYKLLYSNLNPLQILIFERYTNKENSYLNIHKTSKTFLQFRSKLQTLQDLKYVTITGHSYYDNDKYY